MCSYFGCLCEGSSSLSSYPASRGDTGVTQTHCTWLPQGRFPRLQGRRGLAHPWGTPGSALPGAVEGRGCDREWFTVTSWHQCQHCLCLTALLTFHICQSQPGVGCIQPELHEMLLLILPAVCWPEPWSIFSALHKGQGEARSVWCFNFYMNAQIILRFFLKSWWQIKNGSQLGILEILRFSKLSIQQEEFQCACGCASSPVASSGLLVVAAPRMWPHVGYGLGKVKEESVTLIGIFLLDHKINNCKM